MKSSLGLQCFFTSIFAILLDLRKLHLGYRLERLQTCNFLLNHFPQALVLQFLIILHLLPHPSGVLVCHESFSCNFRQPTFVIILIFKIWIVFDIIILCNGNLFELSFCIIVIKVIFFLLLVILWFSPQVFSYFCESRSFLALSLCNLAHF